jgi:hypothetical protein
MAAISCLYAPHGDMRWVDQFVVHIKLFRVSNSYTRFNSMYFLINICATWGNVDRALWIFTNQKLFYLCEHLDFGEPHVAPRLFSFLCCVVILCLFLFVLCHVYFLAFCVVLCLCVYLFSSCVKCHVYSTVPVSLSCTFHIAPWIFSNFDLLETLFMTY